MKSITTKDGWTLEFNPSGRALTNASIVFTWKRTLDHSWSDRSRCYIDVFNGVYSLSSSYSSNRVDQRIISAVVLHKLCLNGTKS